MNKFLSKYNLITMLLWCAFGFCSYVAGARFSVNPVAYIGFYIIALTMVLREYADGLRTGSDIATKIWKGELDGLFEKLRNG